MARALSPSKTWPYVLDCDLKAEADYEALPEGQRGEKPVRTVWLLGALTDEQREKHVERYGKLKGKPEAAAKLFSDVLRDGLRGWEDFLDADGNKARFDADVNGRITEDALTLVPFDYRSELAEEILSQNMTSEADRKNLLSRQQQPSEGFPSTAAPAG